MFVPEVIIKNWKDYKNIIAKATVKVYNVNTGNHSTDLQCLVDCCVFTHRQPIYDYSNQKMVLMDHEPMTEPNWFEMEEFKVTRGKEGNTYIDNDIQKLDNARDEWWSYMIDELIKTLEEWGFVRGSFTGVVLIGSEE
jgi:hypothetical protein